VYVGDHARTLVGVRRGFKVKYRAPLECGSRFGYGNSVERRKEGVVPTADSCYWVASFKIRVARSATLSFCPGWLR